MTALLILLIIIGISLFMISKPENNNDVEEPLSTSSETVSEQDDTPITEKEEDELQEEDVEDQEDYVKPLDLYGEEVVKAFDKKTDFGYVEVRARASYHSKDGGWSFYILNRDGSRGSWFEVEKELSSDSLDKDSEALFKRCSGKYAEVKDYIFTMVGHGTWVSLENPEEEEDEDGGDFIFKPDKLIKVEYDNEDKALIYN